ncbi:hypothetical protein GCM10009535_53640 [Streptomyces thermocarboxydovorans]|uniref:Uncharacterized protein n=1 Tax=Streptomyces thermocarboxydovorans TaxID=59298 RepID=A0ABP3SWI1_9ACTN
MSLIAGARPHHGRCGPDTTGRPARRNTAVTLPSGCGAGDQSKTNGPGDWGPVAVQVMVMKPNTVIFSEPP